jgi:hypothetical protein
MKEMSADDMHTATREVKMIRRELLASWKTKMRNIIT